ncbi:MAG: hypothetical protein BYD32DRAFT_284500 [Podila humilis]|nr:MAG: hypothetical protein BYD32DRAFT_284500 [Podila humilis]
MGMRICFIKKIFLFHRNSLAEITQLGGGGFVHAFLVFTFFLLILKSAVVFTKYNCVCAYSRLELAGINLKTVDKDGVLLGAGVVFVLDTDRELELQTAQLTDLAPVATVQQLLLLLGVDVAGPGVDQVIEQLGSELAKDVLEGLALFFFFFFFFFFGKRRGERSVLNDDSR